MLVAVVAAIVTLPALIEVNIGTADAPLIIPVAFYAVTSIAVIGLYLAVRDPDLPAVAARRRVRGRAPGTTARKYKWMNPIAVAEIVIVSLYLMMPFVPGAVPFSDDFEWKFVNYAPDRHRRRAADAGDLVAGRRRSTGSRARSTRSTRR